MDASGEELRQVAATRTECRQTVKVDRFRIATILAQVKQTISKRVGCRQLAESSAKLLGSFAADYLPFGTFWRSSCKEFCRNTAGPGVSVLRQGASADREDYVVLRAQHKYPYNGGYPMITPHAHVSRSIGNQEMEAKPLLHKPTRAARSSSGLEWKNPAAGSAARMRSRLDEAYRAAARS